MLANTSYIKELEENREITREFLETQGWFLCEEYPLFENYKHKHNDRLYLAIGLYGQLHIVEYHWMNDEPQSEYRATNSDLTIEDYHKIIELLKIRRI